MLGCRNISYLPEYALLPQDPWRNGKIVDKAHAATHAAKKKKQTMCNNYKNWNTAISQMNLKQTACYLVWVKWPVCPRS